MEGPSWLWLVVFVLLIVRFVHKSLCPLRDLVRPSNGGARLQSSLNHSGPWMNLALFEKNPTALVGLVDDMIVKALKMSNGWRLVQPRSVVGFFSGKG
jgi:hypothetical protein